MGRREFMPHSLSTPVLMYDLDMGHVCETQVSLFYLDHLRRVGFRDLECRWVHPVIVVISRVVDPSLAPLWQTCTARG